MPVVSQGSLKPAYFADLKKFLNPDLSEDQGWADLSRSEIVSTLQIKKEEAISLLIEINSQLARTGKAWDSKKSEHIDCSNANLLVLMLNKYPRIKDLGNPDSVGMEQVTSDFGDQDQDEVIKVINWCRRFFGIPGGGTFIELKPGSTFTHKGRMVQGDLNDSTTDAGTSSTPFQMPDGFAEGMRKAAEAAKQAPGQDMVGRYNSQTGKNSGGINITGKKK